ncbi:hypothetical protein [uncultured Pseudokineococcus sp.]|uniref:hypothetical protein n=1 Tax=uncultured Pseudokineococcus sp. TaxID=1642928 RepID=UPI0026133808|nr:hypothetical protein [uncultured Pseudokineococcus sp.]
MTRTTSLVAGLAPFALAVSSSLVFAAQHPAAAASPTPAAPSTSQSQPFELAESPTTAEGSFDHSAGQVEVEAAAVTTTEDSATVTVNGKDFTVTRDDVAQTVTRDGHGNVLQQEDLVALEALARDLNHEHVEPSATTRAGRDHVDLLVRYVALLASAPVGQEIGARVIDEPRMVLVTDAAVRSDESAAEAVAAEECAQRAADAADGVDRADRADAAAAPCQRADEDGILYMSCSRSRRSLYYDAQDRCWSRDYVVSGPGSAGSLGECGPGSAGIDTYTYDCGEHDRCGRVHGGSFNPWDRNCGDEFFEAEDDFLYAPINRC